MHLQVIGFWVLLPGLLLPAALLTAVRLLEPSAGWAIRALAVTPLGVPVYAAALVLLGIGRLLDVGPGALIAPTALAVVGLGLHAWWFSPQVLGANPPAAEGVETITVMTANLLAGKGDGVGLVAEVSNAGVDILAVQEITPRVLAEMERAGLEAVLPFRVGEPGTLHEGTMIFSRLPMGEPTRLPTVFGSWAVMVGGLGLLGVHPAAPLELETWRADLAAILRATQEVEPDLIIGDFNATAEHQPMQALADAGYRNAAELTNAGWQPTWPANGLYSLLGIPLPAIAQIDHVLVGDSLAVLGTRTVLLEGTDHRALIAEVAAR